MKANLFERFPRLTLAIILGLFALAGVWLLEQAAKHYGLGKVVVYQSNPIYGYRPMANQKTQRFNQAQIEINNLGLRANQDWDMAPSSNRVLFIGDSVTFGGSYISNEELFSEQAVKGLSLEAGNAGVNGWGVMNVHALVKELEFTPAQTYVTVLPEGDFYRGLNRLGGQPYWTKQPKWALEELFYYGLYKLYLRKTPGLNYAALKEHEQEILVDIAARHLKDLDDFLSARGFSHHVFITPSLSQAKGEAPIDKRVQKALAKHEVKATYLLDNMRGLDPTPFYHDVIHLTPQGHAQWGQWIQGYLTAELS